MLKLAKRGEKQKEQRIRMRLTLRKAKIQNKRVSKLSHDTGFPGCDEMRQDSVDGGWIKYRPCEMCHKNY